MVIRLYSLFLALVTVSGCSVQEQVTVDPSGQSEADMEYSIIYLLHGDADYLYHNAEGGALQADEEVLKKAQAVAKDASRGEVFIFHQRPERKILWLFPKKDRHMYHYKNGELVDRISYSPKGDSTFAMEAKLYNLHNVFSDSTLQSSRQILLFYGHEIPLKSRSGYYQSRPNVQFGSAEFRGGITRFKSFPDSDPFDLLVLSTCNNGTPDMIRRLKGEVNYVLASPQNLHLSHIDSYYLSVLERDPAVSTADLAEKIADQTFERLRESIQTAVTLALYDLELVKDYVTDFARMAAGEKSENAQRIGADNIDCSELFSAEDVDSQGVRVWFEPAAFGRKSQKNNHSGWGCVGRDR